MYKHNYKLHIAYDGTQYSGWQIQQNATSIQEIIQQAIQTIVSQEITLIGSGRTDAGVHAMGQVAHFLTHDPQDIQRLLRSLNGMLPKDIRITQISQADLNFHAQRSAQGKTYHYYINLSQTQDPFDRLYSLHFHHKFDLTLLQEAAQKFVGTHDFTSFANEASKGSAAKNPIRTITALNVIQNEKKICLEFTANGFLYKMVRNIVGMLLDVATRKRPIEQIEVLFTARDRTKAPRAAPPHGLFLMHVDYGIDSKEAKCFTPD